MDAISGMATRTVKVSPHLIRAIGGHLSERGEVLHYGCDGSMDPFLTLASIDGKRKRERERKNNIFFLGGGAIGLDCSSHGSWGISKDSLQQVM